MRRSSAWILALSLTLPLGVASQATAGSAQGLRGKSPKPPPEAMVLQLSERASSPRETLVVALALQDTARVKAVLLNPALPKAVAGWHRARLATTTGDAARARRQWERAWKAWPALPKELQVMAASFDRQYVEAMLELGDLKQARHALDHPRGPHRNDPRWEAREGLWQMKVGNAGNAVLRFDGAWTRADALQRRDRVFARRALAYLRAGDPFSAAEAWLEYVQGLRGARSQAWALQFWRAHPVLADAVARAGKRVRVGTWLARQGRREEALELGLAAWKDGSGTEAKEGYLLAAGQLYGLHRHEELAALLAEHRPAGLMAEDLASLAAFPWGVLRRQGASAEVAEGFESIVREFDGTSRSVEALWEAGWMWELSGQTQRAEEDFLRYAKDHPRAPFARAAALRAVYLPFLRSEDELVLRRLESLREALGHGAEEACALWLAQRSAERSGQEEKTVVLQARLEKNHEDSPFLDPQGWFDQARKTSLDPARESGSDSSAVLFDQLYERQRAALEDLAGHLGVSDLFSPKAPSWSEVKELLWWGFFADGESRLQELVHERKRDAVSELRGVALAWSVGRAERQAREGWWLNARLRKERDEWGAQLDLVAYPTPYAGAVVAAAKKAELPPALLWALMRRESFYEAAVVSRAGAYGLLQLLSSTAERMAAKLNDPALAQAEDLLDPRLNLRYGSAYLAGLLQENGGDPVAALAAYNAGEKNSRRWKERLEDGDPPAEMILRISYSETRDYVYQVLRTWKIYRRIHPALAR